jgi:hypothetical protein
MYVSMYVSVCVSVRACVRARARAREHKPALFDRWVQITVAGADTTLQCFEQSRIQIIFLLV